jgi:hypothetical protein
MEDVLYQIASLRNIAGRSRTGSNAAKHSAHSRFGNAVEFHELSGRAPASLA